jgi:hypothetical protein
LYYLLDVELNLLLSFCLALYDLEAEALPDDVEMGHHLVHHLSFVVEVASQARNRELKDTLQIVLQQALNRAAHDRSNSKIRLKLVDDSQKLSQQSDI